MGDWDNEITVSSFGELTEAIYEQTKGGRDVRAAGIHRYLSERDYILVESVIRTTKQRSVTRILSERDTALYEYWLKLSDEGLLRSETELNVEAFFRWCGDVLQARKARRRSIGLGILRYVLTYLVIPLGILYVGHRLSTISLESDVKEVRRQVTELSAKVELIEERLPTTQPSR